MAEDINWHVNADEENQQEESSSSYLLTALEDLLKRSHNSSTRPSKIKYQSKSVDDLLINRRYRKGKNQQTATDDDSQSSTATRPELDLSGIGDDNDDSDENQFELQRSRSAPVSPTKIYDQELGAFVDCEQQHAIADSFVYNMDLSDDKETVHQLNSRMAFFFDDDFSPEDINSEPCVSVVHSPPNRNCLTITEENEEELEQLRRDDDEERQRQDLLLEQKNTATPIVSSHDLDTRENDDSTNADDKSQDSNDSSIDDMANRENDTDRLSTTHESSDPQPRKEEEADSDKYDKLIVYDIATVDTSTKSPIANRNQESPLSNSSLSRSPATDRSRIGACYTDAMFAPCPKLTNSLSAFRLCGTTTTIDSKNCNSLSLANTHDENSFSLPVINAQSLSSHFCPRQQSASRSSPLLLSLSTNEQTTPIRNSDKPPSPQHQQQSCSQHVKKMKVIQLSSTSLSDFISPTLISPLATAVEYDDVHHSLTDCSLMDQGSSSVHENNLAINKTSDNHEPRSSSSRRILTNGLLLPHASTNLIPRRIQQPLPPILTNYKWMKQRTKEKHLHDMSSSPSPSSSSSSSSELVSSGDEKPYSRSQFVLEQEQKCVQQRKASSLKSIYSALPQPSSKILYPIDFNAKNINSSWTGKLPFQARKVPTSDSGIVIDTQRTPKSSSEDDDNNGIVYQDQIKQYEVNYRKTLADIAVLKTDLVSIESRLNEAIQELEIEQALLEGEHELVFKQILGATENDKQKIRTLNKGLKLLIERIMTEKNSMRNEIDYTQQTLYKLQRELERLERQQQPSDEKILQKKEIIAQTRKRCEDLEFQYMELEARCESELEKAEEHFQNEQKLVTQNAQIRQNTLRDLDHQQYMALYQAIMEKEKLEREKQKLKLFFKQKKLEASKLEQKINDAFSALHGTHRSAYQPNSMHSYDSMNNSDGILLLRKDHYHEAMSKVQFDQQTVLYEPAKFAERYYENTKFKEHEPTLADKIQNYNYEVKLRDKNRTQERPLTRYLPIRSVDFDLCAHIEAAGHLLESPHISITPTSCRGYLQKMGGSKFKTWNRRWFVFDRQRRSLFYYQDKSESKLRGCIYFQSIVEVYVDHLQSTSLRSPEPREATFIVKTVERPYCLVAPTVELMRMWVDVIITGAEGNTFAET